MSVPVALERSSASFWAAVERGSQKRGWAALSMAALYDSLVTSPQREFLQIKPEVAGTLLALGYTFETLADRTVVISDLPMELPPS